MPEQIRCPECDATLRVPDNLIGKAVKCPKCQTTFTAELDAPEERERIVREPTRPEARRQRPALRQQEDEEEELPPEEEEDEDRPRRRRRRRSSAAAKSAVTGPAISLIVAGSLGMLVALVDLLFRILNLGAGTFASKSVNPAFSTSFQVGNALGSIFDVVGVLWAIILVVGAVKMMKLQGYGLAMTACILGMVPLNCCCILGLPFGIWGLVMLNKPEVKDAFS